MNLRASLSRLRIKHLRYQGYTCQTNDELEGLAFGIRFPYRLCTAILAIAVATVSIPLLYFMLTMAFLGIILPNHPFDYVYNYLIRRWMNAPKVPPRAPQLKFACTIATAWIAGTIYCFSNGMMVGGYALGVALIFTAALPSTIDLCVPSLIYNVFVRQKEQISE